MIANERNIEQSDKIMKETVIINKINSNMSKIIKKEKKTVILKTRKTVLKNSFQMKLF